MVETDKKGRVFPFSSGIFFSEPSAGNQPDLPGFLAPQTAACIECGLAYEVPARQKGRPGKFCSDECRSVRSRRQQAIWRAARDPEQTERGAVACLVCGTSFQPHAAKSGRLPRLCSVDCKREYMRQNQVRIRNRRRRRKSGFRE